MDDIQMYGDAIAYREDEMIKMRLEVFLDLETDDVTYLAFQSDFKCLACD